MIALAIEAREVRYALAARREARERGPKATPNSDMVAQSAPDAGVNALARRINATTPNSVSKITQEE